MLRAVALALVLLTPPLGLPQESEYPSAQCIENAQGEVRFDVLRGKLPLRWSEEATFQMLALDRVPSSDERAALGQWGEVRERCFRAGEAFLQGLPGEQAALAKESFGAGQRMLAELFNGRITFGEFNRRRSAMTDEATKRENAILSRTKSAERSQADLDRDHAACQFDVQRSLASANPPPILRSFEPQSRSGRAMQRSFEALATADAEAERASAMYDSCMRSKGWTPQ